MSHANVALTSANNGFGPLWRKIFSVELADVPINPADLIDLWKRDFGLLWPGKNRFKAPWTGLREGELAEVELELAAGVVLSTGVCFAESTSTSFVLVAPPGHIIAGANTFSAALRNEVTVARIDILFRASDPLFTAALAFGGHQRENRFWLDVLTNLARHCGSQSDPECTQTCLSRKPLLRNVGNIRHNAILVNGLKQSGSFISHYRNPSIESPKKPT